ncbi:MAG: hypothetical protein Q6373_026015 [Candidatus Sigynarchaeota archaeon]
MTETARQEQEAVDGLPVDTGTKFPLDAGRCELCGNYKTWKFKVQNKKTGKMMPGHVTSDGFKIGDGDCPKWAKIAKMNEKRAEKRVSDGASAPAQPRTLIGGITGGTGVASSAISPAVASRASVVAMPGGKPSGTLDPASAEAGHVVAFTVNGFTITTTVADALAVIEQIGAAIRKILGTGA